MSFYSFILIQIAQHPQSHAKRFFPGRWWQNICYQFFRLPSENYNTSWYTIIV